MVSINLDSGNSVKKTKKNKPQNEEENEVFDINNDREDQLHKHTKFGVDSQEEKNLDQRIYHQK